MGNHEQQRDEFVVFYETYFGKFDPKTDPKKLQIWSRFIDRVPLHKIEELMEKVADKRGKARWRPSLEDFKRAWTELTGKTIFSGRHPGCEFCDESGTFGIICHVVEGKKKLGVAAGCFYARVPCLCGMGERFAPEGSRPNREKARQFKVSMLGEMELAGWSMGYDLYLDHVVRRANGRPHKLDSEREPVEEAPEPELTHVSQLFASDEETPEGSIPF